MRLILAVFIFCSSGFGAVAQQWDDLQRMKMATQLGSLLGSEEACGLSFNHDAVARFIDTKVPEDDMEFTSMLSTMTGGTSYDLESMPKSQKVAHCRQIERVARSHGFIE
ncbi:signal recognition particle [Nitratireductor aquimarinus]|uniref:signal recognition particle n=1 Tax=Nitratireductor aquimarinus TaxID=889300 RepID=UPI001CD29DB9|nr:signal recognition particle [Nitratireductor aquimarinus]MCA1304836.1 signal recognition particle [Nitratireductor aquimarinus]MDV2968686.1 signal recognition particle [Nitratireductor aquimarinus]